MFIFFVIVAVLIVLVIQLVIAGLVLWISAVQMEDTNNLLGEIKMKQAEFDEQFRSLRSEVGTLREGQAAIKTALDTETTEISSNFSILNDQIVSLKEQLAAGEIDTSALNSVIEEISGVSQSLSESAVRIGGLVTPIAPAATENSETPTAEQSSEDESPTTEDESA